MDRADNCRRAARDAVSDVEPPRLYDFIEETLEEASMLPGVFTLESAHELEPENDLEGIDRHAAGVQLIYEGLRLTRALAHEDPWTERSDEIDGDLEILAADILVARGFYLLARTDAAGKAVRTVQAFGRNETRRADDGNDSTDTDLERNVLELATLAGASAVGTTPTPALLETATELADTADPVLPPAEDAFPTHSREPAEATPEDGHRADRATSATDS
ncbi:hypothetical protein HALLA_06235 [Halostagnicola larsenii XH-48]|uniref:Uncharacterized protein n=1 Tax=Halostagnicola larsenii XH-48 TaxID=797299 RepID=W0JIS2_9EURY|nr:hypothetical protein [Halostagnicola larsenii]AHF98503.1 hypothetical protein HALLA_06235 [Halostagnicola larsenii XH-48]